VTANPKDIPPPVSTVTVAHMIQLFEYMFQPRGYGEPLFDIHKLPTALFAMTFEREFLSKCEYLHYWNFASILPTLYDGSFYDNPIHGKSTGQAHLRGFATYLCGTFAQYPNARSALNDSFEQSLFLDGYRFNGKELVETDVDTSASPILAVLPNRECLLQELSQQLQNNETVAVLFIDLDHFKPVNDQLGHDAGTECLSIVVQTIGRILRHKGKLYRVGGDEFAAMLPNFSCSEALVTAERVRASIDNLKPFGGKVKVTASVGIAASDGKGLSTPEALVKAADDAMYVSKFTTKNRICSWPPLPAEAEQAEANRRDAAAADSRR
jgi:diguanylate cyclase (GGDEF)-like protein